MTNHLFNPLYRLYKRLFRREGREVPIERVDAPRQYTKAELHQGLMMRQVSAQDQQDAWLALQALDTQRTVKQHGNRHDFDGMDTQDFDYE